VLLGCYRGVEGSYITGVLLLLSIIKDSETKFLNDLISHSRLVRGGCLCIVVCIRVHCGMHLLARGKGGKGG
jgi:hypothetical protein